MTTRPYINLPYRELSNLHLHNWNSLDVLYAMLEELKYRKKYDTGPLQRIVANRINELGGKPVWYPQHEPGSSTDRRAQESTGSADHAMRINELASRAARAERQVEDLTRSLVASEERAKAIKHPARSAAEDLYARLGLVPDCPDFVFEAAMREFRKKHHPDLLSHLSRSEQLAAQEQFKNFEVVFRQIKKIRDTPPR